VVDGERTQGIVLESDSAAFVIRGYAGQVRARPWDGNSLVRIETDVTATGLIFIETGDQWGPFDILARQLSKAPLGVDDRWEDVAEFSVATGGPLLVSEVFDPYPAATLVTSPGRYRVRVCAQARKRRFSSERLSTTVDEEEPTEWYLLEAWPAPDGPPQVVRLTSDYAQAVTKNSSKTPAAPPGASEALAAAARIGSDVDMAEGARRLTGEVDDLSVNCALEGAPESWIRSFAYVVNWTHWWAESGSWVTRGFDHGDFSVGLPRYGRAGDHIDQLSGSKGAIRTSIVAIDPPNRVVRNWNWVAKNRPGRLQLLEWPAFLPSETVVTVVLERDPHDHGDPRTLVHLSHENVPSEWIDDLTLWWQFQLDIAHMTGLGKARAD